MLQCNSSESVCQNHMRFNLPKRNYHHHHHHHTTSSSSFVHSCIISTSRILHTHSDPLPDFNHYGTKQSKAKENKQTNLSTDTPSFNTMTGLVAIDQTDGKRVYWSPRLGPGDEVDLHVSEPQRRHRCYATARSQRKGNSWRQTSISRFTTPETTCKRGVYVKFMSVRTVRVDGN